MREALTLVYQKTRQRDKIRNHVETLESEREILAHRLQLKEDILEKEGQDVEELSKLSVKSLFFTMLGSKEKQQDKQRSELLKAFMEFQETSRELKLIDFEISVLKQKLILYEGIDEQFAIALDKTEAHLKKTNPNLSSKLHEMGKKLALCETAKLEIIEARDAGQKTGQKLNNLIGYLRKAKEWGTWKMVTSDKHGTLRRPSNMDKAVKLIPVVNRLLSEFYREMIDVYNDRRLLNSQVRDLKLPSFTELIFDNFLTDWMILQRIDKSLTSCYQIKEYLKSCMDSLGHSLDEIEKEIQEMADARESLLLNY